MWRSVFYVGKSVCCIFTPNVKRAGPLENPLQIVLGLHPAPFITRGKKFFTVIVKVMTSTEQKNGMFVGVPCIRGTQADVNADRNRRKPYNLEFQSCSSTYQYLIVRSHFSLWRFSAEFPVHTPAEHNVEEEFAFAHEHVLQMTELRGKQNG